MSHKSLLLELCQKKKWRLSEYRGRREGPYHILRFTATMHVNGVDYTGSQSSTTKRAVHDAVRVALERLKSPPAAATSPVYQKSLLQELCQQHKLRLSKYDWEKAGPEHYSLFGASVFVVGFTFSSPFWCTSRKCAKNEAAKSALDYFNDHPIRGATV